jgi:3-hydroxybutyryl-CoA dehydratase
MTSKKAKPLFLSIRNLKEGQSCQETIHITDDMVKDFILLTQDQAAIHMDSDHANRMGFKKPVVHGLLVGNGYSKIMGMFLPGSNAILHKINFEMLHPVFVEDLLTYKVEVSRIILSVNSIILNLTATNQDGILVNRGSATSVFQL